MILPGVLPGILPGVHLWWWVLPGVLPGVLPWVQPGVLPGLLVLPEVLVPGVPLAGFDLVLPAQVVQRPLCHVHAPTQQIVTQLKGMKYIIYSFQYYGAHNSNFLTNISPKGKGWTPF